MPERKRRILLVSVLFPPDQGGVEAAAGEFAAVFPRMGYEVTVATVTRGACFPGEADVRVFPEEDFPARVGEFAREIRADLVFVNGLRLNGGMGLPFAMDVASGIPVVYRSHGFNTAFRVYWRHPPFFGMASFVRSFVRAIRNALVFRKLSQVVFLEDRIGVLRNFDVLLSRLIHPANVSFLPNSFSSLGCPGSNAFRERFGIPSGLPLFLCVANYSSLKGQCDAIRILRDNPGIDASFVFIGSSRNETCEIASKLAAGDPRIRVMAGLPREMVVSAVNASDSAFLFSRHEQQPLFLSEAMSCGKPWFCPDVGSVSDMRGGIVLRRRDARHFVRAVRDLLSPGRRQELGRAGREFWTANYAPEVVYGRWKCLLDDVIVGKAGSRY